MNMELIKNLKGARELTGCLMVLSYFILRLDERGLPLYKLLKKGPTSPQSVDAVLDHSVCAGVNDA
jgi:hypothetical protein